MNYRASAIVIIKNAWCHRVSLPPAAVWQKSQPEGPLFPHQLLPAMLGSASDGGDPGVRASPYQSLKKDILYTELTRDKFPNECPASETLSA